MQTAKEIISFQDVAKNYRGGNDAVENINITINEGEFVCLIGTSGSGKTTTMRMINRMIEPSRGKIIFKGKNLKSYDPVKLRRTIGYVIQNNGLMPHMTIKDNITLVPKLLKWPQAKMDRKAKELIKLAELPESYLERYPAELSGGQQQRIGVVRALAADQDIILMDEPFGALDPITRDDLQELVKHLQEELGKTIIFVTHDMDEALKLATHIVIMDSGNIIQDDTPDNILQHPASDFVKDLLGEERLLQAQQNTLSVSDIMSKDPAKITLGQSLAEAIREMSVKHTDTLLVTDDNNKLKGYIDLETINDRYSKYSNVSDIYLPNRFKVKTTSYLRDTSEHILKQGYKYVPVIDDDNNLIGIVTRASLVNIIYDAIWGSEELDNPEGIKLPDSIAKESDNA
ncbi:MULTISPECIES: betaine/proline/choline family ABC transporter ATP-binding protein [Companilactobacillus]|uniref:Quaternary amine transport ATP-binding protein n=1 Tax=Companilactobacillus heilongjiangensis TaxID=1074467 RepID=A0A0K2LC53_9LACO|nr:betaine/proline/choline family ABC transporter ATP-binding protein [Companilactobacillus heilongjiangensis]ALB28882.1 glycine/betaine ABC transporter ATP-binding protein [Companilactobacillus heilongjiangensis]